MMTLAGCKWLGVPSAALVLVAALLYQRYIPSVEPQNAVYVIGDLHGDAFCARHWVEKTGLIFDDKWLDPSSSLVFLGDYIDKGPTSKQTLEFVKSLTAKFPNHVTALLGNHEVELLRERDVSRSSAWGKGRYFQLSFAATHPAEYLNYLDSVDGKDEVVVEALYNASVEVYSHNKQHEVFLMPNDDDFMQYIPVELQDLVKERLKVYQDAYLNAFSSDTPLGMWLEQRPIVALQGETLLVHGGVSPRASQLIQEQGIEKINTLFQTHSHQDKIHTFLATTAEGQAIYELVTFRGNHNPNACPHLPQLLPEGASRLGVGHTPHYSVERKCNGQFWALDSSLGRHFRNSGNEYCRGDTEKVSSNGRYKCRKMNTKCEGQIIRIMNGQVEVIDS